MPRPAGLRHPGHAAALALALSGPGVPAVAQETAPPPPDCALTLSLAERPEAPGTLALTLEAPCHPYAALTLDYGPLDIAERTGLSGRLDLDLPRLAGARSITAALDGQSLTAAVPPGAGAPFVALDWGAADPIGTLVAAGAPLSAHRLGLRPGDGAAHLDLLLTSAPVALELPVTPETCGQEVTATVLGGDAPGPRALSLRLPPCDGPGGRLRLPLD